VLLKRTAPATKERNLGHPLESRVRTTSGPLTPRRATLRPSAKRKNSAIKGRANRNGRKRRLIKTKAVEPNAS